MAKCGGCGNTALKQLFSLGDVPPVNAFLDESELSSERAYPLEICYCEGCSLVQLSHIVDPDELFSHYHHLSSASQSNLKHLSSVASLVLSKDSASLKGKKVLELGSNDGSLLALMAKNAEKVLGVDPAKNLAALAREKGVETVTGFFSEEKARELKKTHGPFDWIVALNVVAHTPDFTSLFRGVRELLAKGGTFMMEAAYVVETILNGQFDTVYHEHVYCFSLHALKNALERSGLSIKHAEIIPTQGCSIRVFVSRDDVKTAPTAAVGEILKTEKAKGFTSPAVYEAASVRIKKFSVELNAKLRDLKKRVGGPIVALGAPARGVVILNYCKIGPSLVDYVIDDTPLKQGKLVPGAHIPVRDWSALADVPAKIFLILSWNYKAEILEKLKTRVKTAVVLIPFPEFQEVKIGE